MGDILETLRGENAALLGRVSELEIRLAAAEATAHEAFQAAQIAQAGEERARILFELMPDAMYLTDLEGHLLDGNRAAEELLGYALGEVLGRSWFQLGFLRPENLEVLTAASRRVAERLPTGPDILTLQHKDGAPVIVELFTYPVNYAGQPAVLGLARNVTARTEREASLRREHAQLLSIFEAMDQPVSVSDTDSHTVLYANRFLREIWTYDPIGRPCYEVFAGRDAPCPDCTTEILRHDRDRSHYHESYNADMDRTFRLGSRMIQWPDGRQVRLEIGSDITDLRRAEKAARDSEARYRGVVETSPDAIFVSDLNGTVLIANQQAAQLLGREHADDLLGIYFANYVVPEQREVAMSEYDHTTEGGTLRNALFEVLREDGSRVPVEVSSSVMHDKDGRPTAVTAIIRDISERRELEERLLQAQKMEAIGRLAGGVAHDFNNLLTVISGYAEMALDGLPAAHPVRSDLHEIATASKRATDLTHDLLAFSRRQMLRLEVVDINGVLAPMGRTLQRLIGENVSLFFHLAPAIWSVKADPSQLSQVVMNLAINARDAMPEGGTLTIETANITLDDAFLAKHRGARAGDCVRLRVSDTGVGMSADVLERLFEPFYTTKDFGQGSGLGLAVVFGIIKQSGGSIFVESAPGQGSTFDIYLPRVQIENAAPAQADGEDPSSQGQIVLVVEAESGVRQVAQRLLQGLGYYVETVESPYQAIERCSDEAAPIALVLCDVVMPDMPGQALAQTLMRLPHPPQVLFMSGYSPEVAGTLGVPPGEGHLIHKPFVREELARIVRQVLAEQA